MWKVSKEVSQERVARFLESPEFEEMPAIDGAAEALRRLSQHYELHVVTSRQFSIIEATHRWLNRHFPGVFTAVHFGNHFGSSGAKIPKSQLCKEIGAIALVDDSATYIEECSGSVPHRLLFGNYAWNTETPSGAIRCSTWADVESELMRHQSE